MKPHLQDRINKPLSVYIFGYLFIWVGLTTLFYNEYGIVGAVAENVAWSNHLDVMYYKHPGLGALFIKIVSFVTFGNYILMASLASRLCILTSLIYIYKICRLYFSEEESALLVMATTFSGFYLFRYFLSYDQNIILLPFWVIATYYFLLVKKSNMSKDWILLTIFTALGVYAKFEMLLLSAGMLMYIASTI